MKKYEGGCLGHPGGSVGWASDSGSGHDLPVHELESRTGLAAVSTEPASDPLPPPTPPLHALKNKTLHKKKYYGGSPHKKFCNCVRSRRLTKLIVKVN